MPDTTVKNAKQKHPQFSTQLYMRIAEIHDDTVVLKNGGLRGVLSVGSVNMNLKSEEEQNAIAAGYQQFLNSLEFPLQIVIRSKKLDIGGYLDRMGELEKTQTNELMKKQVAQYTEYISRLVDYADIMQKEFYVVVPHDPYRAKKGNMFEQFWQFIHPADSESAFKQRRKEFQNLIKPLRERLETVQAGLENMGLTVRQLQTPELIQLFYESYNPATSRTEKTAGLEKTDIVTDTATALTR